MPIPKRRDDEDRDDFMLRCMSDSIMNSEYPDKGQRFAVCQTSSKSSVSARISDSHYENTFGSTEIILDESEAYIPDENEYLDFGEEAEEYTFAKKDFKPHTMYDKDGNPHEAKTYEDHLRMKKMGYTHTKADKPGKNDPRRTPAPKKDRKKGSKKNKPGSAKDPRGKITFSKQTIAKLSKKVKEHNAKGKGSKATLGMLKAVYRRGAGAYSTSHAPKMSRDGWAMARVNAFLTLLRTGKPSNSAYTQDNDLLPKGHPRRSKAKAVYKYEDPKTGEIFTYRRKGLYKKDGRVLKLVKASEYQGKKVTLNKPFRTPKGPKKFSVYVKNDKGNVVKVNFGDPNMEIKRDDPDRRKSFRARHKCDTNPGPKWKAKYWSCKFWESKKSVTDLT
tara:strand:- start:2553 stop:3719 length:1167 start_codon:yes stop_codon:yes gene_type:complete